MPASPRAAAYSAASDAAAAGVALPCHPGVFLAVVVALVSVAVSWLDLARETTLGIDLGTTHSVAATCDKGVVSVVRVDGGVRADGGWDDGDDDDGFGGFGEEANVEDAPGRSSAESSAATRANLRGNLRRILAHLDEKIEVSNAYVTAERVMEMAARAASLFEPEHAEGVVRFEPTTFAYASSPDAARTFFAPLAWRLVVEQEGFQWDETTLAGGMLGRAVGEAL